MNWVGGVRNRLKVQNDKRQKVSHVKLNVIVSVTVSKLMNNVIHVCVSHL